MTTLVLAVAGSFLLGYLCAYLVHRYLFRQVMKRFLGQLLPNMDEALAKLRQGNTSLDGLEEAMRDFEEDLRLRAAGIPNVTRKEEKKSPPN